MTSTLERDSILVHEALSELVRVYQFRDRRRVCYEDISVTECYAIEALLREGPLSLGELAARLYLDKSTASRAVDSLERKGYAERLENPADRRALLIKPTARGRRLHARIERKLLEEEQGLLADVPSDVRRSLARVMQRFAQRARKRCGVEDVAETA